MCPTAILNNSITMQEREEKNTKDHNLISLISNGEQVTSTEGIWFLPNSTFSITRQKHEAEILQMLI